MSIQILGRGSRATHEAPVTHPASPDRIGWGLVLSCASAMAVADGFLVVALRGVAGSIERTDHLSAAWIRESLLLLPVYVVAVLAAVTLAGARRPVGRSRHPVATTLGAVAVAGTVAGVLWVAASAAYDYRLQAHEVVAMPAMQRSCTGACAEQMQHASLVLQARTVGIAAAVFLVGNLLLVLWVHALRGGGLVRPGKAASRPGRRIGGPDRLADLRLATVAGLLGAALIHLAVVPEHLTEWPLAGAFFVALAVAELAAARLVVVHRSPVVFGGVALLSLLSLALWTVSRTSGLPFGPEPGVPEAVGFADVAACVLELVTLVACLITLRAAEWVSRPSASPHALALGLTSLLAVTTLGLGGSGLPVVHAFGVAGHDAEQEEQEETAVPPARLPGSLVTPSPVDQASP